MLILFTLNLPEDHPEYPPLDGQDIFYRLVEWPFPAVPSSGSKVWLGGREFEIGEDHWFPLDAAPHVVIHLDKCLEPIDAIVDSGFITSYEDVRLGLAAISSFVDP